MVRDFPNSTDQPDEISLTISLSGVSPGSSRKGLETEDSFKLKGIFPPFRSEWKGRTSTIFERSFQKITLPFDFKQKCPDFLGKWQAPENSEMYFKLILMNQKQCENLVEQKTPKCKS